MDAAESVVDVEPFKAADRDEVWAVISAVWCEFGSSHVPSTMPDLNSIQSYYSMGAGGFWVARNSGRVVGTIALKDVGDNLVTLKRLYVLPEFRGEPFQTGQKLLSAALDAVRSKGVEAIYLGTPHFLKRAQRFYEKNGFQLVQRGELPESVLVDPIDTHFYALRIEDPDRFLSSGSSR